MINSRAYAVTDIVLAVRGKMINFKVKFKTFTVPSRSQGSLRPHLRKSFPALLVQSNSQFLIGSLRCTIISFDWLIDWLISDVISLPRLAVAFLPRIVFFLTALMMSSRNIYTPKKVVKSGQKWLKVARSGQKWPEVSEDSRNPSFRWEKITEEYIKNAFIACGIVDKHGSYDVWHSFFIFFRVFLFENCLEWSFWSVDW